jgi:hypothetical protein
VQNQDRRKLLKSYDVARNTIKAILKDHGIEPAPERGTKTPWKTFLAAHWDGLAAADFFKTTSIGTGAVTCRARLGGLLKFYDREAA